MTAINEVMDSGVMMLVITIFQCCCTTGSIIVFRSRWCSGVRFWSVRLRGRDPTTIHKFHRRTRLRPTRLSGPSVYYCTTVVATSSTRDDMYTTVLVVLVMRPV